MRWLAAFFVFAGHLRNPIFIGYPDVPEEQRTPLISALYFISGFGTGSVIVFFVLSGFLIGSMGMAKLEKGAFRPVYYAIDRVTRLFIVYLPALVLTYWLDSLGNRYFGESGLCAGFSYTLYLLHFPLMLFVIGAAAHVFHIADLRNGYLPNSTVGIALYAGTLVLVLAIV